MASYTKTITTRIEAGNLQGGEIEIVRSTLRP